MRTCSGDLGLCSWHDHLHALIWYTWTFLKHLSRYIQWQVTATNERDVWRTATSVIAQSIEWPDYGLGDRVIKVRYPVRIGSTSPHVQTGCGTHSTSYPVSIGGYWGVLGVFIIRAAFRPSSGVDTVYIRLQLIWCSSLHWQCLHLGIIFWLC
jgi:hypothetical protein